MTKIQLVIVFELSNYQNILKPTKREHFGKRKKCFKFGVSYTSFETYSIKSIIESENG